MERVYTPTSRNSFAEFSGPVPVKAFFWDGNACQPEKGADSFPFPAKCWALATASSLATRYFLGWHSCKGQVPNAV